MKFKVKGKRVEVTFLLAFAEKLPKSIELYFDKTNANDVWHQPIRGDKDLNVNKINGRVVEERVMCKKKEYEILLTEVEFPDPHLIKNTDMIKHNGKYIKIGDRVWENGELYFLTNHIERIVDSESRENAFELMDIRENIRKHKESINKV